jgi:hypothetical protein
MLPKLSLVGSGDFNPLGKSISAWKAVNNLFLHGMPPTAINPIQPVDRLFYSNLSIII